MSDEDEKLLYMRAFVTTPRLLKQMKLASKILATDGRYKSKL